MHSLRFVSLFLALWIVSTASAAMVASDPFTDGGRSNGADTLDVPWYTIGWSAVSVASDAAGINAGNALRIAPAAAFQGAVANLPAVVTLQDDHSLRLSFKWRFTGTTNLNQANLFRYGIFNSGGTLTTADNTTSVRTNDKGYFAATNPGLASSSGTTLRRETPGTDDIVQGATTMQLGAGAAASVNAGTTTHTAQITITRQANTLVVSSSIDGLSLVSAMDSSPVSFAFDEIAVLIGGAGVVPAFFIDDVQVAYDATVVNDPFTDGARSDGADPQDIVWRTVGTPTVAIVNDAAGLASGNAMQLTSTTTFQALIGHCPWIYLNNGDSVMLSFRWRFTGTTGLNQARVLRFGLHEFNGTPAITDNTGATVNDRGYFIAANAGATGSNTSINRETGADPVLSGNDVTVIGSAGASVVAGTTAHSATFTITRSGNSLSFSANIDGQAAASATDASPVTYAFDQVGILLGGGSVTSPLVVDNVEIKYSRGNIAPPAETIGGGTVTTPATGPAPAFGIGGTGMILVKNWNFGANGTIKNYADMNANFYYHDQFGTIANGTNYGAKMVSPDAANALSGQPIEGVNTVGPVREFFSDSLRTYLKPLNGATTVTPTSHNAGCGSFMAKWELPNGGSLLNHDIVWETKVRYVTPPYFWFAIWNSGNQWNHGAEIDLVESFGYDNGGGFTNYTGRYWHSDSVGGTNTTTYSNWGNGMNSRGINTFQAGEYHTWTLLYRKNNTYSCYIDGIEVQNGTIYWTFGAANGGTPIDMNFLFDAGWGHTQVQSVNKSLPAADFVGKFYEWKHSRVYLK